MGRILHSILNYESLEEEIENCCNHFCGLCAFICTSSYWCFCVLRGIKIETDYPHLWIFVLHFFVKLCGRTEDMSRVFAGVVAITTETLPQSTS
jgi:hypothetical protein